MKLFDLYIRILKRQMWLYAVCLALFLLFIFLCYENGTAPEENVFLYYRCVVPILMVLIMLSISAVTAVNSDADLSMRHRAAPIKMELLELAYLGADFLVTLFWWMLFFWTSVVLYGEAAYSVRGLLLAWNLQTLALLSETLGFMIGMFAKSAQSRVVTSALLALGLWLAGGSTGFGAVSDKTVDRIRSFTPVFWYQKTVEEVAVIKGMPTMENLRGYAAAMGIQLVFALMLLTLGMMLDKQRKEMMN